MSLVFAECSVVVLQNSFSSPIPPVAPPRLSRGKVVRKVVGGAVLVGLVGWFASNSLGETGWLGTGQGSATPLQQKVGSSPYSVLGVSTDLAQSIEAVILKVNVPAVFTQTATFEHGLLLGGSNLESSGSAQFARVSTNDLQAQTAELNKITSQNITTKTITAGNILYGLKAGEGLTVGTGQTPTLTNTGVLSLGGVTGSLKLVDGAGITVDGLTITNKDPGSAQNIFKTIQVAGQSDIAAGSNTDTLTFASGGGITITTDSGTKKVTITSSDPAVAAGWTHSGTSLFLTTGSDSVGVGTTSPASKLHVVGDATITGGLNLAGSGLVNAGAITGATGFTSSGQITFSALSTGILHSDFGGVITSSPIDLNDGDITGVLPVSKGGTNLTGYTTGDMPYASAPDVLNKLAIGANGQILTIAGGVPTWGAAPVISGASCTDCVVTDPGSTQTITPGSTTATGLVIKQANGGTADVFKVTDFAGTTSYFRVDAAGNVILGNGQTTSGVLTVNPANTDPIAISPTAKGTAAFTGSITSADLTQARTWTFPDETGVVCLATGNCTSLGVGVGGSGTANYLSKWQSTTGLSNSLLYDDGTNVGIGTTTPGYKIDVNGTGRISGATTLGSTLGVSGATTLSSTLNVTGTTDLNSTLGVVGATTLSSTLGVTGNTTVGGTLTVNGTGNHFFAGKVGIGTTNPSVPLDVNGQVKFTATAYPVLNLTRNVTTGGTLFGAQKLVLNQADNSASSGLGTYYMANNSSGTAVNTGFVGAGVTANTAGSEVGYVLMKAAWRNGDPGAGENTYGLKLVAAGNNTDTALFSGNVGIGTTSPSNKLHIVSANNGDAFKLEVPATNSTVYDFYLGNTAANTYIRANPVIMEFARNGAASTIRTVGSANDLAFTTNDGNITFMPAGGSGGKVGIGTTAPATKLEIALASDSSLLRLTGNNQTVGGLYFDASGSSSFISSGGQKTAAVWTARSIAGGGTATISMLGLDAGMVKFYTNSGLTNGNTFTPTERMRIDTSGNVGIGTTNPSAKLNIEATSGNILDLTNGGTSKFAVNPTGDLTLTGSFYTAYNGSTSFIKQSNVVANNPAWIFSATSAAANGAATGLKIAPTYNQSTSTASNTDLWINRTETSLGSGTQYLIDAGSGGGSYVSKFNVTNTGQGYFAGNVGIGTTNPGTYTLDVNGTIHGGLYFGSSTEYLKVAAGTSTLSSYYPLVIGTAQVANPVSFTTNSLERMRIDGSGNVGIGTTNPTTKAEVIGGYLTVADGEPSGAGRIYFGKGATYGYGGTTPMYIRNNAGDWAFTGLAGEELTIGLNPGSASSLNFTQGNVLVNANAASASLQLQTQGATGLTLLAGGNVGIGTTNPGSKFVVYGISSRQFAVNGGLVAIGDVPNVAYNAEANIKIGAVGDEGLSIQGVASQTGNFLTISGPTAANALLVKANGNVGIGTTSPAEKLDISGGNIRLDVTPADGNGLKFYSNGTLIGGMYRTTVGGNAVISIDGTASPTNRPIHIGGSINTNVILANAGGNVGIGTTNPGYKLQVGQPGDGTEARANAWNSLSDLRFKKNVVTISGGLDKILQLNGVAFDWKSNDKANLGFIAQDVQKVFPELVSTDNEGVLSLNYAGLSAPMVEAIKEQQLEIESLKFGTPSATVTYATKTEVSGLQAAIDAIKTSLATIEKSLADFKDRFTTKKLCIGENGDEVCVTKTELETLIKMIPTPTPTPTGSSTPAPSPTVTPAASATPSVSAAPTAPSATATPSPILSPTTTPAVSPTSAVTPVPTVTP